MGSCYSKTPTEPTTTRKQTSRRTTHQQSSAAASSAGGGGSNNGSRWTRTRSSKREESAIHEQALAAAVLLHQQLQTGGNTTAIFNRSTSLRNQNSHGSGSTKKNPPLPRSSSSRARSLNDPLIQPHQLVNQELKLDEVETKHFVLVHGGGFGAWCWYKTIALLEEAGFTVTAVDLTGSGVHSFDTNSITSLAQHVKPLTDFLENLSDGEKVILVGHDFGGTCISYAMEIFPSKISKAVFIAAAMLTSGQSTLDMFSQKEESNDLMQQAHVFIYAKGNDYPPTAIDLNKPFLRDLLFNQSPSKDVALATVSMRPIPFSPVVEKLSLTDINYGSVRRFYVQTSEEDNAMHVSLQQDMISKSPPERVFYLKGADHAPFFSKPQALHKILLEICKIQ